MIINRAFERRRTESVNKLFFLQTAQVSYDWSLGEIDYEDTIHAVCVSWLCAWVDERTITLKSEAFITQYLQNILWDLDLNEMWLWGCGGENNQAIKCSQPLTTDKFQKLIMTQEGEVWNTLLEL